MILRGSDTHHSRSTKFLRWAIRFNALLICLEALTWQFDGIAGVLSRTINLMALNLLFFLNFAPILCLIIYYDLLLVKSYTRVVRRLV